MFTGIIALCPFRLAAEKPVLFRRNRRRSGSDE